MKHLKLFEQFDIDDPYGEETKSGMPTNWFIKVTHNNVDILKSFRWGVWDKGYHFTIGGHYSPNMGRYDPEGPVITIEEFKNHYGI